MTNTPKLVPAALILLMLIPLGCDSSGSNDVVTKYNGFWQQDDRSGGFSMLHIDMPTLETYDADYVYNGEESVPCYIETESSLTLEKTSENTFEATFADGESAGTVTLEKEGRELDLENPADSWSNGDYYESDMDRERFLNLRCN